MWIGERRQLHKIYRLITQFKCRKLFIHTYIWLEMWHILAVVSWTAEEKNGQQNKKYASTEFPESFAYVRCDVIIISKICLQPSTVFYMHKAE